MTQSLHNVVIPILYLLSAVLFIYGLKGLTRVRSAQKGNAVAALAMFIAVATTLLDIGRVDYRWILVGLGIGGVIGVFAARRVEMTGMPELVALFNGLGGAASALVATAVLWLRLSEANTLESAQSILGIEVAVTVFLSIVIGSLTFSGSLIAFMKLSGRVSGKPILLPGRHVINSVLALAMAVTGVYLVALSSGPAAISGAAVTLVSASLLLGILMVIPIGGADMPVVISLLNSLSGVAAAATGFVLSNNLLIIAGALVGASGLILTQIMCVAMNRSLGNVLFRGFGETASGDSSEYQNIRSYSPEEAAMVLESASSVVIVPGYGLAVAQAQHTSREVADLLQKQGTKVSYAIHPVAGRMPGHMNVLLAEADVPYEQLVEMDAINPEFKTTDAVLIVGANDVVNPAAEDDPTSPIAGMPILQTYEAGTVMVIKRSLSPGFAGIKNGLFERDNTMMVFGDAKKILQELVAELKSLSVAA
jgi:NAD(P) transhydrogenase subunit beta